jgi:hypothetical protein
MPGHVKKNSGPDEDPLPYLVVTLEMKREHAMKVYDSKKSYWCPDNKGNFIECLLESDDGTKAVVMCGHEVIHSGSKSLPRVAYLWSKMSMLQRLVTPTSISIFDSYNMKSLLFKFGH